MTLDLLVNPHSLVLESLRAEQPVVAIEASQRSCGESCRDPVGNLDVLVGEPLDGAFRARLLAAFGGPRGCSHLLSLFQFMASAIGRGVAHEAQLAQQAGHARDVGEYLFQSSLFIDGFRAPDRNFLLTLQLADYLVRPEELVTGALERFEYEDAVRADVVVQTPDMTLSQARLATRERTLDSLAASQWQEHPVWAAQMNDRSIMGGFTAHVAQTWGGMPDAQALHDGLLQLAPAFIQVMAAVADQWIARSRVESGDNSAVPLGAGVDSCYIWREGGKVQGRSSR